MQFSRILPEAVRFVFFLSFLFALLSSQAQDRCGSEAPSVDHFEPWLSQKIERKRELRRTTGLRAPVYEIPVVVHIIEPASGASLGISDERIIRQIEILNEDFRRTNADASNTPAIFLPVAADAEIQFTLARQDPSGNATSGIVRVRGSSDSYSATGDQQLLRSESFWPPSHFLNIYVADLAFFLGYASLPISDLPGINNNNRDYIWDGVIINHEHFGENPSSPFFQSFGRTLTHEVGHYLGLRHIWGDGGCSVDDFVSDTPVADSSNDGLGSPCTFPSDDSNVCETDEMFQNYMDYTNDTCMNLFTLGQKERMRVVLENSPRRLSLITSPGLSDVTRVANDAALTQVLEPQSIECANEIFPAVEVTNVGSNEITSYTIALTIGGITVETINRTTSLGINETEVVTFGSPSISSTPVSIDFTLAMVNGLTDGNTTNNIRTYTLTNTSSLSLPYSANFESGNDLLGSIGAEHSWDVVNAPASEASNNALQFKAFGNTTAFGEKTLVKTPIFNLSGINSAELRFSYAYANIPDDFQDGLTLKVSTDCGTSFSDVFLFNSYGPNLATAPATSSSFTPQNASEWRDVILNITVFTDTDGVQFAFQGQNGGGNNIYLDDISVVQTEINAVDVSVTESAESLSTCRATTSADFTVRNVGFEEVTSITYQYTTNNITQSQTLSNLSLVSGAFQTIDLELVLEEGLNTINLLVTEVNGLPDDDASNNSRSLSIDRTSQTDTYPLLVDFESANSWKAYSYTEDQLWSPILLPNNNGALQAKAFLQTDQAAESWFISPSLNVGTLDSAGLSFKASYANRAGFNDRLRVLMSINCGEFYSFELLNADADSLAITTSESSWMPTSDADWKEFRLDLKQSILWGDEIRLAFVFTNTGGNNLYIDDIQVGIKPKLEEENRLIIFPNPAQHYFNLAFDLPERQNLQVQLVDVTGKSIFTENYQNVLDQVYSFRTISMNGFYFVKITGETFNKTERLYIRR